MVPLTQWPPPSWNPTWTQEERAFGPAWPVFNFRPQSDRAEANSSPVRRGSLPVVWLSHLFVHVLKSVSQSQRSQVWKKLQPKSGYPCFLWDNCLNGRCYSGSCGQQPNIKYCDFPHLGLSWTWDPVAKFSVSLLIDLEWMSHLLPNEPHLVLISSLIPNNLLPAWNFLDARDTKINCLPFPLPEIHSLWESGSTMQTDLKLNCCVLTLKLEFWAPKEMSEEVSLGERRDKCRSTKVCWGMFQMEQDHVWGPGMCKTERAL